MGWSLPHNGGKVSRVRFLSDEEAREAMEKELEQPAPQHILDILTTARPIPGKETSEVPITTLENCAVERSKEVAGGDGGRGGECHDTGAHRAQQGGEGGARDDDWKGGQHGHRACKGVGERSWRCGDEGERPAQWRELRKSGASLKTAPGDRGGSIADGERQEDTAECGTRQGAWERTGGEKERLADV